MRFTETMSPASYIILIFHDSHSNLSLNQTRNKRSFLSWALCSMWLPRIYRICEIVDAITLMEHNSNMEGNIDIERSHNVKRPTNYKLFQFEMYISDWTSFCLLSLIMFNTYESINTKCILLVIGLTDQHINLVGF